MFHSEGDIGTAIFDLKLILSGCCSFPFLEASKRLDLCESQHQNILIHIFTNREIILR